MKTTPGSEKLFFPARQIVVCMPKIITPAADYEKRRHFCTVLVSGVLLTGLCVAFVDRPVSTWLHSTGHNVSLVPAAAWYIEPLMLVAAAILAVAGAVAALSHRPPAWIKDLIACCLAVMTALVLKEKLKFAFGRTFPESWKPGNPSWIGTGAYGFHPFHGGPAWGSFPSGHTAAITAAAGVLWDRVRSLRWLWGLLVVVVSLVLLSADCHFVGDIVAGFCVGIACAATVLAIAR